MAEVTGIIKNVRAFDAGSCVFQLVDDPNFYSVDLPVSQQQDPGSDATAELKLLARIFNAIANGSARQSLVALVIYAFHNNRPVKLELRGDTEAKFVLNLLIEN